MAFTDVMIVLPWHGYHSFICGNGFGYYVLHHLHLMLVIPMCLSYLIRTRYKFQSNTMIYYTKYFYGNMFWLYWVVIRPSKEKIQCIKIRSAFCVPKCIYCVYIFRFLTHALLYSTVLPIVSVWDPRMHYEFWYIGSVL